MTSINHITDNLLNNSIKILPNTSSEIDKRILHLEKNIKLLDEIEQRKKYLIILKKFIVKNKKNFVKLINLEVFKTLEESIGEYNYALEFVDYAIQILKEYKFNVITNKNRKIFKKSSGLVFAITPYNDPLAGMIRKIAPSLAAGSPIIVKTSSYNLKICKFFDIFLPIELKKILKFVFIKNKQNIDRIIKNEKIKIVTFTGSTEIGLKINSLQTRHFQKKILELGGINYAIINDKKNLQSIIQEILIRKIKAAGQACSSINKVFVNASIKKDFEAIVKIESQKIICGDIASKDQPNFGPVISMKHFQFLVKLMKKLINKNKLIAQSNSLKNCDNLLSLQIFQVGFNDDIFDNIETFGPLLGVSYYSDEKKLFKKISLSKYSLVCYFFSSSKRFINLTKKLNFGSIGINTTKIQSPASPTGGNNLSGIGREGGIWGFEEFLSTVNYVNKSK